MSVTKRSFYDDVLKFREIFGNKNNPIEMMERAFACLTVVYLFATVTYVDSKTSKNDIDDMQILMAATSDEWTKRRTFMMFHRMPS